MTNALPAAAWFPDPEDASRLRWWDGAAWTDHVHVMEVAPQAVSVAQAAVPVPQPTTAAAETPRASLLEMGLGAVAGGEIAFSASFGEGRIPEGAQDLLRWGRRLPGSYAYVMPAPSADSPATQAARDAEYRADGASKGMNAEQIEAGLKFQRKVLGLIRWLERGTTTRQFGHMLLRRMARATANREHGTGYDRLSIHFDGMHYVASGPR